MGKVLTDYEAAAKHRYRIVSGGSSVPGVTTCIGILDKPQLKWASAKIAAQTAVDNIDNLYEIASSYRDTLLKSKNPDNVALGAEGADEDVYAHWCRGSFDRVWREKADRGTRVHSVAESWVRGETVDVSETDKGFVDALEAFFKTYRPKVVMAERIVLHLTLGYGGRFDAIMEIDGKFYLIDFKTGNEYTLETALQAAGYMGAELATYDDSGALTGTQALPHLDGARIVYLHEDGTFRVVDPFALVSQADATLAFNTALELYRITNQLSKNIEKGKNE